MDKFKSSQITKVFFILAFLVITPLLSSSLRPTYFYLALNILIIALGAQSGLISFISTIPEDHKKRLPPLQSKNDKQVVKPGNEKETPLDDDRTKQESELLQKSSQEKFECSINKLIKTMKKFNSTPSLVVGGKEEAEEAEKYVEDDFQENVGGISEEELYAKAETFIGNFYKQLKIQREESWQNIDGVYKQSILSH